MVQRSLAVYADDRRITNRLRSMVIRDQAFERDEIPEETRQEIHSALASVQDILNDFVVEVWHNAGLCEYFNTSPDRGHVVDINGTTQAVLIGSCGNFVRFAVEAEPMTFLAVLFSTSPNESFELLAIDATEQEAVELIRVVKKALTDENGPRFHPQVAASDAAIAAFG